MLSHVKDLLAERIAKLSLDKTRNWLKTEEGVILSPWKTRQIKGAMELEHYKIFEALREAEEAERVSEPSESAPPVQESEAESQAGSEDQES